ncbi:MFS transporter [Amycolatopsis lurida]
MAFLPTTSPRRAGRREWAALGVLMLAVVLLAIDATVLYMAVPALTADLAPSATQLLWIGDIYSFALAGLLITMGNVADRVGRKRLLVIGCGAFGLASVMGAFAFSPEMLIAARALLGVAGATIMPSTLSIVRAMFEDPKQRARAIAAWAAGATGGAALGPLVGGALLERFWWGSVFLINVPIMVIVVVAGIMLLPESRNPQAALVDLPSAVLSIVSIVTIVYAVKHVVGTGLDWSVPVAAAVGVAAAVLFVMRQRRLPLPLVDIRLFRLPAFSGAVGASALSIFAFSGVLFFFSQYLQLVRGYSPLLAGLAELPMTLASIVVIMFIGALVTKLGAGRAISLAFVTAAVGLAGLSLTEGLPTYWGVGLSLTVLGLAVGVAMTLSTDAVVSVAPRDRAGAAASISETAYELGVALGIAVLGSLQTAFYRANLALPATVDAKERLVTHNSLASASSQFRASGRTDLLEHAQHAFTVGMQVTSGIAAALMLVAAVVAWRVIPSERTGKVVAHEGH